MAKRYFTVEEANALLPFVQSDLSELQRVKQSFEAAHNRLQHLKKLLAGTFGGASEDPLFTLECEMEFLQIEANTFIRSILSKGVEVKDIDIGLVDFPAILEGEEVLLCWRQGEGQIQYYHGLYDGYKGRKPLPGPSKK